MKPAGKTGIYLMIKLLICYNFYLGDENIMAVHLISKTYEIKLLPRVASLFRIPCSALKLTAFNILGAGAGIANILTVGKITHLHKLFDDHSKEKPFPSVYKNFLRFLNPKAKLPSSEHKMNCFQQWFVKPLKETLENFRKSDENLVKKHLVCRVGYLALLVVAAASRVMSLVIAAVAVPLSIITLGKYQFLNKQAYLNFRITGIIYDLLFCGVKVLNPWPGIPGKR